MPVTVPFKSIFEQDQPEQRLVDGCSLGRNWHFGPDGRWSRARDCSLRFDPEILPPGSMLALTLSILHGSAEHPGTVIIHSPGHAATICAFDRKQPETVLIRSPALGTDNQMIFALDHIDSPFRRGLSIDERQLGIFLQDVNLLRDSYTFPLAILTEEARRTLLTGHWGPFEGEGVWSTGERATILLPAVLRPAGVAMEISVKLELDIHVLPRPAAMLPLEMSIEANDHRVTDWTALYGTDRPARISVQTHWPEGRPLSLDLRFRNLKSPQDLGVNSDRRSLGLFLRRVDCQSC